MLRTCLAFFVAALAIGCLPADPASPVGGGAGGGFSGAGGGFASGGGAGGGVTGGGSGGGGGSSTPDFVSGTRLKARYLRSSDGTEVFAGWRDTQRNADCAFWPASDGERRCVPSGGSYLVDSFFADAQCTVRVYRGQTCTPPTVLYQYDQTFCPARWSYYAVGAAVSQQQIYFRSGTNCSPTQLSAQESAWLVGAALPADSFVRGTVSQPAGATGIGIKTLVADDGARQIFGTKDLTRNADCNWGVLEDGATHCFPAEYGSVGSNWYADNTCTSPALPVPPGACAPPAWAVGTAPNCPSRLAVYSRGAALSRYYTVAGSQCTEQPLPAQYQSFAVSPIAAASFPVATKTPRGSGRLQRERVEWPGGLTLDGDIIDTQHGTACSPWYTAADGQRRCLPTFLNSWYFADAACTQRVVEGGSGCSPGWGASWETGTCATVSRVHVYRAGARHTGPIYYSGGSSCTLVTGAEAAREYYLLGAEVPADQFVPFTEVVR